MNLKKAGRAVLHIGLEKTGTSYIQKALYENSHILKKNNLYFSRAAGRHENHHWLFLYAANKPYTKDLKSFCELYGYDAWGAEREFFFEAAVDHAMHAIGEEAASREGDCIIYSSEHCSSRLHSAEEISRLRSALLRYHRSVDVVMYVRNQCEKIPSHYSTRVKTSNYEKFTLDYFIDKKNRVYDYYKIYSDWEGVFGKNSISVGLYDKRYWKNGLLEDFLVRAGLNPGLAATMELDQRENVALSGIELKLLRHLNRLMAAGRIDRPMRQHILNQLRHLSSDRRPFVLTENEQARVIERFGPSNERFCRAVGREDWIEVLNGRRPTEGLHADNINAENELDETLIMLFAEAFADISKLQVSGNGVVNGLRRRVRRLLRASVRRIG